MPKSRIGFFDLVAVATIVLLALLTAVICFGILESTAQGSFRGYSVGGAMAGLVVSATLFTSIYLKIRKSSEDQLALQRQVDELRIKLLRSKVPPPGFTIEVDERRQLVFARPRPWTSNGGLVFNYTIRPADLQQDKFPGHCDVAQLPIPTSLPAAQNYYDRLKENTEQNPRILEKTFDTLQVGPDDQPLECLRISGNQYIRFVIEKDEITGVKTFRWSPVTGDEYLERQEKNNDFGSTRVSYLKANRLQVYCYHRELNMIFWFRCLDLSDHWSNTSATFHQILQSIGFLA